MLQFIVDILLHDVCGWIGSKFITVISVGRINLDFGDGSSEAVLAEWIGLLVLVGLIVLAAVLWARVT
jgi:hypothetical protein